MKKPVDKLVIIKNKKTTDANGQFNYVFEWFHEDQRVLQEVKKLMADIYNIPVEDFDLNDIIEHKKHCCMIIDENLNIEEVEV